MVLWELAVDRSLNFRLAIEGAVEDSGVEGERGGVKEERERELDEVVEWEETDERVALLIEGDKTGGFARVTILMPLLLLVLAGM